MNGGAQVGVLMGFRLGPSMQEVPAEVQAREPLLFLTPEMRTSALGGGLPWPGIRRRADPSPSCTPGPKSIGGLHRESVIGDLLMFQGSSCHQWVR